MKKHICKKTLAFVLSVLFSLSAALPSYAFTNTVEPYTVTADYTENEENVFVVDLYVLNVSAANDIRVDYEYDSSQVNYSDVNLLPEEYDTEDYDSWGFSYGAYGCSVYDMTMFNTCDIWLARVYFERAQPVLYSGAEIKFIVKVYTGEEAFVEKTVSVKIPAEKVDPEKFPEALKSGDVDGDGVITASDARIALRLSVNLDKATGFVEQYADANANGKVEATDARTLLRISVKLESEDSLPYFLPKTKSDDNGFWWDYDISDIDMTVGESKTINNVIIRKGTRFSWSSSNTDVATVSENGTVKALKDGFSCVILTIGEQKYYYEVYVISELQKKIYALKDKYPNGYYWNNHTPSKKYPAVSETPCSDHAERKYEYCKGQCAGFAETLFCEVFPNAKRTKGVTWNTVKVGDYVRLKRGHSIFITDVVKKGDIIGYDYYTGENYKANNDYVEVVHCNWGCNCDIRWGGTFDAEYELDSSLSYTAY